MIGAIIGDVVGSGYEFNNTKTQDFELFTSRSSFTDDSVCTIAFMDFLLHAKVRDEKTAVEYLQRWTRKYPNAGYGGRFHSWVHSDEPRPYGSYGNGAAMRISAVAYVAKNLKELEKLSNLFTEITHDHPEGMKGALVVATCIFMALHGKSKVEIAKYAIDQYHLIGHLDYDELVKSYTFDSTCQGSVPQAIFCFLISNSFEECLRKTVGIGGDCDTTSAISCAIAEARYSIPDEIVKQVRTKLDSGMLEIIDEFKEKYGGK